MGLTACVQILTLLRAELSQANYLTFCASVSSWQDGLVFTSLTGVPSPLNQHASTLPSHSPRHLEGDGSQWQEDWLILKQVPRDARPPLISQGQAIVQGQLTTGWLVTRERIRCENQGLKSRMRRPSGRPI